MLPDETRARSLRDALEPFEVAIEAVDGHYEMSIQLVDRDPDSRVVNALGVIDRWLMTADLPFVQVHLNGAACSITSPAGARGSERAAPEGAGVNPGVE